MTMISKLSILLIFLITISTVYAQMDHNHGSGSGSGSMGGDMDMGDMDDLPMCVQMPQMENCVDYQMPDALIHSSIENLCMMMPFMSGCSVADYCAKMDAVAVDEEQYCEPFSILRDLCIDMPGMSGCMAYNMMCSASGSVVDQCNTKALALPSTMSTQQLLDSMCSSHYMEVCEDWSSCKANGLECDMLSLYSSACRSMPTMGECSAWHRLCGEVAEWQYCTENDGDDPVMIMYFHTRNNVYVLFESWVPDSDAAFAGTWFAIFFSAIVLELWRALRAYFEFANAVAKPNDSAGTSLSAFAAVHPFRFMVDALRACLHLVDVAWALLLMLVAMTFNAYLFLAIIFGAFFGNFAVGRYSASSNAPGSACH